MLMAKLIKQIGHPKYLNAFAQYVHSHSTTLMLILVIVNFYTNND